MSRRFSMGPDEGKRVQRSVYYASNSDPSEARYMHRMQATYTWMFVEDMSHIIPPRANDENYREKVSITPNIRDLVCRISNGFDSFNDGYHRDIAYPLSEFLRLLMGELCFDGVARFEIARLFEPGKGTPTAFKLAHLNPFQLRMTDGQLVQVVPPDTAKQYGVATEIPLPEEDIVTFRLPPLLRRQIAEACESLNLISLGDSTDLFMQANASGLPYVFSDHNRAMQVAIAAATASIGWNARGAFYERTLPTFWLRREVAFRRFSNQLRCDLLDQINALLVRIGPRFWIFGKDRN